jgi:thymidylate kinase
MTPKVVSEGNVPADFASSILARLEQIPERILVFGSLPPEGRDLDLLVRDNRQRNAVEQRLTEHDFAGRGDRWFHFGDAAVTVVELASAEAWHLPAAEVGELFDDAEPLPGTRNVVLPSPTYTILILARKRVWSGGAMAERHRWRIDAALADDPDVWLHAAAHAAAWDLRASLSCLRAAYTGDRPDFPTRVRAVAEAAARAGDGSSVAGVAKRVRQRLRLRRGALFALSGLDGAGKSLQAATLVEILDAFGRDVVVIWSPLGSTGIIAVLGDWGKRLAARLTKGSRAEQQTSPGALRRRLVSRPLIPAGHLRFLKAAWLVLMGLGNVAAQVRTATQLMRGRDVVCDRHVLDSAVHLLHRYGDTRAIRFEISLISFVSPRPRRAYLLEVAPEVALRRKVDRWTVDELAERAQLYRKLHKSFGVRSLDGEQTHDQIATEIARDIWNSLRQPQKRRA